MKLQEIDPHAARLCLAIEDVCREKLPLREGHKLLLAVSGGADSLALALIFHILSSRLGIELAVCHINHGIRPEAGKDEDFVEKFCNHHGLPFSCSSANVPAYALEHKLGLEEAGRIIRLQELEKQRQISECDFILLGHHSGDLAEDILMRITRGAAWPAMGGMSWQNGYVLRPLLHTNPVELRSFLHSCRQNWREDPSNAELTFKRNRFRHVFLPLFRCENPAVEASFKKIHEFANLDSDYWESEIDRLLNGNSWRVETTEKGTSLLIERRFLSALHPAVRLRLYNRALRKIRELNLVSGQARADTLLRLDKTFISGNGGKIFQCGGNIVAKCSREGVTFCIQDDSQ